MNLKLRLVQVKVLLTIPTTITDYLKANSHTFVVVSEFILFDVYFELRFVGCEKAVIDFEKKVRVLWYLMTLFLDFTLPIML